MRKNKTQQAMQPMVKSGVLDRARKPKVYDTLDNEDIYLKYQNHKMRGVLQIEKPLSLKIYQTLLQNKDRYMEHTYYKWIEAFTTGGENLLHTYTETRVQEFYEAGYLQGNIPEYVGLLMEVLENYTQDMLYPEQARILSRYTPHTEYNYSTRRADTIAMFIGNSIREASVLGLPALLTSVLTELRKGAST